MNIRETFKNNVASSAFKVVDGVTRITGKFGELEIIDDIYDVYFVGPNRASLTEHKITAIQKKLPENANLIRLNGEAYLQTTDLELARQTLHLLGVRKKKQLSEETLQKMRERLMRIKK